MTDDPNRPPEPLGYASSATRPPPASAAGGAAAGFAAYVALLGLMFLVFQHGPARAVPYVGGAGLVGLIVLGSVFQARGRWRGFLAGLLIAVGLSCLLGIAGVSWLAYECKKT